MRLKTIGGLRLDGEGSPGLGPRPLALLALVAAAGKKGISRDRVVGILWSEAGEEQARHTLSQTLYNLRREVGGELIAGTAQLYLNPSLSSDIGDLRAAALRGDLELVADLYTGRFLDGFYLPGAAEFERWVDAERADLEREAVRALERLARLADEAGKHAESARWWQRLGELDPLSAQYVAGHMRALAAQGDRSGALARAKLHREVIHRELNTEPDATIRKLEQALKNIAPEPPVGPAAPGPTSTGTAAKERSSANPRLRGAKWLVPAASVVLVVAAVALRGGGGPATPGLPVLAVGDIRVEGAADSGSSPRILRDMLATSLGAIEGLQVVANSRLVELMPPGPDPAPRTITDAARRAGATEVIEGELTADAQGLRLSLRRVTAGRGIVRKGYVVRAADRPSLADSASAAIARDLRLTPPALTVAQSRTASPVAYALYDEGLRAYYGYDAAAAYRLMTAALARDSSFGMAAYYVWHLSRFLGDADIQARVTPHVQQLALRTIERERLLIQLSVAVEGVQPTAVMAALADTLTVKYPRDPDGQILLGQVRAIQGDWMGAVGAYEAAFRLDSTAGALSGAYCRVCRALSLETIAYTWWDSLAAAERTARRLIRLRPEDQGPLGAPWNHLVEVLLRQGRRIAAEDAQARSPHSLTAPQALPVFHRDLIRWGQFERVDRELKAEVTHPNPGLREDAWWLLVLSLRDQGRLREADTLIHRWRVPNTPIVVPGKRTPAVDFAFLGLEMGRPEVSIRAHRENVATMSSWAPAAHRARNITWQLALAGTAHAAAGDTAVVRRLADSLEVLGPTSAYAGRDARLSFVLRGLLLQRQGRHAEAVDAFRRSLYSLPDGYTRTNLMMARSLLVLRRPAEAIAVLRPAIHGGVDGSNTYVSRTELHEAMALAFELAGRRDSAVVHWRAVESAWRHADPQFRDRYLRARLKAVPAS